VIGQERPPRMRRLSPIARGISRRWLDSPRCRASTTRRECAERPRAGWSATSCRSASGHQARRSTAPALPWPVASGRPDGAKRLRFWGRTVTIADRHSLQTLATQTHKSRSAWVSRTHSWRDGWRTWSWCHKARISSCSAARERMNSHTV
jgi:hypothetical protein